MSPIGHLSHHLLQVMGQDGAPQHDAQDIVTTITKAGIRKTDRRQQATNIHRRSAVFRAATSLKQQLVWIVSACALGGLAAMSLANIFTARNHLLDNLDLQARQITRERVDVLGAWARDKQRIVQASLSAIDDADPLPTLKTLKEAGGLDNTYFGHADARYIFANPAGLAPDYNPTVRPWYKAAVAAGKPVLTAPYVDAGSKKLVVTSAIPVMSGGQVKAVAAADIFLDRVVETVS